MQTITLFSVSIQQGQQIPLHQMVRVSTAEAFDDVLAASMRQRGPLLIEAVLDR